jgi:hypothetical protein
MCTFSLNSLTLSNLEIFCRVAILSSRESGSGDLFLLLLLESVWTCTGALVLGTYNSETSMFSSIVSDDFIKLNFDENH